MMRSGHSQSDPITTAIAQAGISKGARILVAVSGGADSVALLHGLAALAEDPDREWSLRVGHVNHGLRGRESEADEEFVRRLASDCGPEVSVARVDTRQHAYRHRLSLEAAARELRRQALLDMLSAWPGDVIATGHTEDDQAETLLLRLLRGSALIGLGAMRTHSGRIIRPLLSVRHDTVVAVLQERGQAYRLDTSNLDLRHARNRLRWDILPLLQEVQPGLVRVLSRTAGLLRQDAEYVMRESELALAALRTTYTPHEARVSRPGWSALHPALRGHTIRLLVQHVVGHLQDVEEEHIALLAEAIEGDGAGTRRAGQLPHDLALDVDRDHVRIYRGAPPSALPFLSRTMEIPGEIFLESGTLSASFLPPTDREARMRLLTVCGPLNALCDAQALGPRLLIRPRRPGDRMRPLGSPGSRKLQDIMADRKVPREERDLIPLVENGQHVVWIPGVALDGRVAVGEDSESIVQLRFTPVEDNSC